MKTSKLITILTISVASILLSNTPAYSLENENVITPKTQEEILGTEEKLKDLDEYIKVRNSQKGYGSKKVLSSYKSVRQQAGPYCGPTAAYNSTNGAFSISEFANLLGTKLPTGGTNFPGRWVSTMNKATNNKNNYQILRGPDYGITTWREKIKNSSIYTIDKGYPVIADCYIQSYEDRLHPSYNYATDTKHYVGIIGYDDRPQITPALLFIVDSNNRTTIPTTYWSEMNNVTYATDQFGIIW